MNQESRITLETEVWLSISQNTGRGLTEVSPGAKSATGIVQSVGSGVPLALRIK